jgi:hypothetical protein
LPWCLFWLVVAALLPVVMAVATVTVTSGLIYAIAQFLRCLFLPLP